jgi:hypothetical protein
MNKISLALFIKKKLNFILYMLVMMDEKKKKIQIYYRTNQQTNKKKERTERCHDDTIEFLCCLRIHKGGGNPG